MRIVIATTDPVQEIAAEPATLARLATLLDRGRELPGGLCALPRIPDPTVPPLTVHLRPSSTRNHA